MQGNLICGVVLVATGLVLNWADVRYDLASSLDWLLPVVAVALIVMGAGALLHAVWRKGRRWIVGVCVLAFLAYLLPYLGWVALDPAFWDEGCEEPIHTVINLHVAPPSVSQPGRPAVFGGAGAYGIFHDRQCVVGMYGVTERPKQEAVLAALRDYHRLQPGRPIRVRFYEKENWRVTQYSNGVEGGDRGPEKLIRVGVVR